MHSSSFHNILSLNNLNRFFFWPCLQAKNLNPADRHDFKLNSPISCKFSLAIHQSIRDLSSGVKLSKSLIIILLTAKTRQNPSHYHVAMVTTICRTIMCCFPPQIKLSLHWKSRWHFLIHILQLTKEKSKKRREREKPISSSNTFMSAGERSAHYMSFVLRTATVLHRGMCVSFIVESLQNRSTNKCPLLGTIERMNITLDIQIVRG